MMNRKTVLGVSAALLAAFASASCSSGNRSTPVTFGDRMAQSASEASDRAGAKSAFSAEWSRGERLIDEGAALARKSDRDAARADREIRKLNKQLDKLNKAKTAALRDRTRAQQMSAEGFQIRAAAEAAFREQFPSADLD